MAKKAADRSRAMVRLRRAPAGSPPGTLLVDPAAPVPTIHLLAYGPSGVEERSVNNPDDLEPLLGGPSKVWINVDGLGDAATLRRIGEVFDLHPLALEDVVNAHQRAKVEAFDKHLFVVGRMPVDPQAGSATEQLSIFVGANYLLTFQEHAGDSFDPIRQRLRQGAGAIRQEGPDYLAYAVIDAAIDSFFPVLERCGEDIDALNEAIVASPQVGQVRRLHYLKRDLISLRRAIWPLREMVNALLREETPLLKATARLHLRDCYDHAVQLMDVLETYREIATGLLDLYLSSQSARLNEIMKVLTIIATIFIPLSFLASLYGMNFDTASPWNMPELHWRYGYVLALGIMATVALGLMWLFWRRGWLKRADAGGFVDPAAEPARIRPRRD
ncbi:MAG: magnesium/cobalt transporter CorA [Alphaproteobacteria bacterium]|nr:magnesium/cobalt transporter CorA [Alphaproteobacteria bacterium]